MDDQTPRLRALLNELHAELEHQPAMDDSRRAQWAELKADIERLLTPDAPAAASTPLLLTPATPSPDRAALRGRLQSLVVGFEGAHPQLASTIEQAMNSLSNFGL